jgi:hypothetical protein
MENVKIIKQSNFFKSDNTLKLKPIVSIMSNPKNNYQNEYECENENNKKFLKLFKQKRKNFNIDKPNFHKEYVNNYNFVIKNSSDIKYELLRIAEELINRKKGNQQLLNIIKLEYIADRIEKGIFEFALLHVTLHKLQYNFVAPVYTNKLTNLCVNLDINNKRIQNYTLLPNMLNNTVDPYFLAFLAPEQLHPERWSDVVNKINIRDKTKYEMKTTDIYKCKKCGERKCTISELQLRGLDENKTIFVVCLVCCNTFTFS